eukprot:6143017-Alexandrium_andersonii.AAC.1
MGAPRSAPTLWISTSLPAISPTVRNSRKPAVIVVAPRAPTEVGRGAVSAQGGDRTHLGDRDCLAQHLGEGLIARPRA